MSDNNKYQMTLSMNVLEHLGLHLYSNMSAVIAEAVANAWDADATEVEIRVDKDQGSVIIRDNGIGMNLNDINDKFLRVGYKKREEAGIANKTPRGRLPMGRKGIGKLSLFSIGEKICIYTKTGEAKEAFQMETSEIQKQVDDNSIYNPHPIRFDIEKDCPKFSHGTIIKITDLKKAIRGQVVSGLRKRIARRFSIMSDDFSIQINGQSISFEDRDYFHKARFLFEYGNRNFAQYCRKLDKDESGKIIVRKRDNTFNENGDPDPSGSYSIEGWVAYAHSTKDLNDKKIEDEDNLNKITLAVRGKVGQEDLLHEHSVGGIMTKYLYGEIHADFLDNDDDDDIATSSRQKFNEHDQRYVALKKFMANELKKIHAETNKLTERPDEVPISNSPIAKWFENLPEDNKKGAIKILEAFDKAGLDTKENLHAEGVLVIEKAMVPKTLKDMDQIDPDDIKSFIKALDRVDQVEEANYHDIVDVRLEIIQKLTDKINEGLHENEIQKYLFGRLWLLSPGWERSAKNESMEQILRDIEEAESDKRNIGRAGISYRKSPHEHVIVEFKKPGTQTTMAELMSQMTPYIQGIRDAARKKGEMSDQVVGIILVETWPQGWDDPERRNAEERALQEMSIRIMRYKTLLSDSKEMYKSYSNKGSEVGNLCNLLKSIRQPLEKKQQA